MPDAYDFGLRALSISSVSYFQSVPRIAAWLGLQVSLAATPTVLAAVALLIQAAPAGFLMSRRLERAWPGAGGRAALAALYVCLPNAGEVFVNVTNSQWHLAMLALLVLHAAPARTAAQATFDAAALLACGSTGPFAIVLAPLAAARTWSAPAPGAAVRALLLTLAAALQLGTTVAHAGERSAAALGASPSLLADILSHQVVLGALLGPGRPGWSTAPAMQAAVLATAAVAVAGAAWRGPPLLRGILAFGLAFLAAALIRPQASLDLPQWTILAIPGVGQRYWLFPMFALLAALVALACDRDWRVRAAGALLLAPAGFGIASDFAMPRRGPTDFVPLARQFDHALPGALYRFPIQPPGQVMLLVKH